MLCCVMLCYGMLCYGMSCYVMLCYGMLCYVMLCCVMLRYVMLGCGMLCCVMLCYVMICYDVLFSLFRFLPHFCFISRFSFILFLFTILFKKMKKHRDSCVPVPVFFCLLVFWVVFGCLFSFFLSS